MSEDFLGSDLAGWVAALLAIIGAGVAGWQARIARQARDVAERQADAAKQQADAVTAQTDMLRAERDERAGPKFSLLDVQVTEATWHATVTLEMSSGPPLVEVSGRPIAQGIHPTRFDPARNVVERKPFMFTLQLDDDRYKGTAGRLDLTCVEHGGEHRTWNRQVGFSIPDPSTAV